ncbi:helicase HerA-like domain-containing protein [Frigoribacterium sp. Leaf172]|uniref:helicase HerA-like domain-containing protein n=1 Tax=Frigoribacterium sp. Leaf172 TaxID=1736285 RepID=UPI0006F574B4|nr:helicase HerA-like domain-containing protein [Frigoribacterium sp. Leaf172]KQR64931.1 ATPase [Frigoribacterium sp. Leaf172]
MTDALEQARAEAAAAVAAAEKAKHDAEAALARAERLAADAAGAPSTGTASTVTASSGTASTGTASSGPLSAVAVDAVRTGYAFGGPALELGALVNGDPLADVPVRIPLGMLARHGLVAGATGTGKTKTLQVMAEQLSAAGVPVFAADVKGDLSGIATPGESGAKLLERTRGIGQDWSPEGAPTEYFALGGIGTGVPVRATVSGFGSLLLAKVLGLNDTQESSLGLVFHYAEQAGLPLLDLADLRAVLVHLTSDEGEGELDGLGGLSRSTVGVILRELITFADQGADAFFGEPEIDTAEFLRTTADGRGVVSLLELPGVHDRPALFSTFLMWLLADLYNDLPEVGDLDRPKLVFFFDEAHLLFADASKEFTAQITRTVRLIRSKGVGIVFVTQTPKDVPADVLAQLGSRVQHQLRAFTPDDAKALRATVSTYPTSEYELDEVLTSLAIGEAVVTVMNEKGAPSPVAWTRVRAPRGSMSPTPPDVMAAAVAASPLQSVYGAALDRDSAREMLARRLEAAALVARERTDAAARQAAIDAGLKEAAARERSDAKAAAVAERERKAAQAEYERQQKEFERAERTAATRRAGRSSTTRASSGPRTSPGSGGGVLGDVLGSSMGRAVVREVVKGIFGTLRRR